MAPDKSTAPELHLLSLHLTVPEAAGLAHLCHVLEWNYLAEHTDTLENIMEARYALAKLRFALADAGFIAMPTSKDAEREPKGL